MNSNQSVRSLYTIRKFGSLETRVRLPAIVPFDYRSLVRTGRYLEITWPPISSVNRRPVSSSAKQKQVDSFRGSGVTGDWSGRAQGTSCFRLPDLVPMLWIVQVTDRRGPQVLSDVTGLAQDRDRASIVCSRCDITCLVMVFGYIHLKDVLSFTSVFL